MFTFLALRAVISGIILLTSLHSLALSTLMLVHVESLRTQHNLLKTAAVGLLYHTLYRETVCCVC